MWFGTDMGVHSYDGTTWRLFTEDDGQLRPPVNALLATRDGQVYAGTEMGVFGYRDGGWHRVFPEGDFPWPTVGLTEGQGGAIWAITAMGALRLSGRDVLLYTSPDQAAALAVIAPTCPTVIVPERILSRYIWEPGIGVRLFSNPRVGWRTEFGPWLIEGIALHSPAEAAGLAVGDLMLEVDGIQPAAPELSMSGPPGRPLTLTVLQPGQKEPVLVDVTRADFGEKLWYWFGSPRYRSKHSIGIDSTASVSGSRSAYIGSVSTDDEVASSLLRVLDPEKYGGRKLSVSARLRLQDVAKAVTVGADVQGPDGKWHSFEDSRSGTTDWVDLDVVVDIPSGSSRLQLGVTLIGTGKVLIDVVRVEVADSTPSSPDVLIDEYFDDLKLGSYTEIDVTSVCELSDGNTWFGLSSGLVAELDGQADPEDDSAWRVFETDEGHVVSEKPKVIQTRDGAIWTASAGGSTGAQRFDGKRWEQFDFTARGGRNDLQSIKQTRDGSVWLGTRDGLYRYHEGSWSLNKAKYLGIDKYRVIELAEGPPDVLWLALRGHHVHRVDYGSAKWATYGGLAYGLEEEDGTRWFISEDDGVVSFSNQRWRRYGAEDGLIEMPAWLLRDGEGRVWVAGSHDSTAAAAVLDGETWERETFPTLSWGIQTAYASTEGELWLGGAERDFRKGQKGGLLRRVQGRWTHYVPPDVPPYVYGIGQSGGTVYVGGSSLHLFDGKVWSVPNEPKALLGNFTDAVLGGRDLWVASRTHGLFMLAQDEWRQFTGVVAGRIRRIYETLDGSVWAVSNLGVSRFDGRSWMSNALPSGMSVADAGMIEETRDGILMFSKFTGWDRATPRRNTPRRAEGDLALQTVIYRPDRLPPKTEIASFPEAIAYPGNTTMSWSGVDLWEDTPKGDLEFSWRLSGGDWSAFTKATSKALFLLPSGDYEFQVRARDKDFNIDPSPASARFVVAPPVWRQAWFIGFVTLFCLAIALQTRRIFKAKQHLLDEAERELQTAHDMQMGLMPTAPPSVDGLDVAGRCVTANHVGGDLFQYFQSPGSMSIALADVTGKAMDAAIPVVMFSGILDNQMEEGCSVRELFPRLNRSLNRSLDTRTFICFELAEIDLATRTVRYCNGGLPYPYPYPYHYHDGEVSELQVDTYPLGVRSDTEYEVIERQLSEGDCLVFCSDGFAEEESVTGEQFGYDRASKVVERACREERSAEGVIDHLLSAVAEFRGDSVQTDDMTCVVVKVLGEDNGGA